MKVRVPMQRATFFARDSRFCSYLEFDRRGYSKIPYNREEDGELLQIHLLPAVCSAQTDSFEAGPTDTYSLRDVSVLT
jgi:hypothetical protein